MGPRVKRLKMNNTPFSFGTPAATSTSTGTAGSFNFGAPPPSVTPRASTGFALGGAPAAGVGAAAGGFKNFFTPAATSAPTQGFNFGVAVAPSVPSTTSTAGFGGFSQPTASSGFGMGTPPVATGPTPSAGFKGFSGLAGTPASSATPSFALGDMDRIKDKPSESSVRNQKDARSLSTDIGRAIHRGISELYHEGTCADFEIIVGNKTFRCHKVVLAAVSDYFRAMFTSGMKETIQNQTTFEDICPKVFEVIFNMVYPDYEVDVLNEDDFAEASEKEMSELLRVAEMLQMRFLLEKCCSYFKNTMSPTNCIERWQMAKTILNKEISEFARNYLLCNFQKVVSEKMLLTLEFEDFRTVIENENLTIINEDDVWRAIYEWIKFDETKRKVHLTALLKECCLTELEENTLIEEIVFDPLIRENDGATKLVQEAVQYRRHPVVQGSMEVKLRENVGKERMLVLICKNKAAVKQSSMKKSLTTGLQTIFKRQTRQTLITVRPVDGVREGLAFCIHGDSLFVSSGQKLLTYIAADDTWTEREQTPVPLRDHMMCASDEYLFVVGGMSGISVSSQVLKYNLQDDTWNITGEIMVPVCHASSVCIKNKIYIFGGKMDDGQLVDSVQEFDIRNDTSTIIGHLPTPCEFLRAVNKGDVAYIVTSDGQVIQFSAINHQIDIIATLDKFRRVDFGIEMRDGAIHIHGGRILGGDSDEDEDEIGATEVFASTSITVDVTSGKENTKAFSFPMQVFGCASVIMSTKSGSTRIN